MHRFRGSCVFFQVYNFTLTLDDASAVPSSMRVTVSGDAANWTVIINKTCSDTYYHWTSDTELTNCVEYVCGFLADRILLRAVSSAIVMMLSSVRLSVMKCIVSLRVGVRG